MWSIRQGKLFEIVYDNMFWLAYILTQYVKNLIDLFEDMLVI